MKKFLLISIFILVSALSAQANEIKRIFVGNESAKISIIAFESLTCSYCAKFHQDVYPLLKKEFLDTGLAKIEFKNVGHCYDVSAENKIYALNPFSLTWEDGGRYALLGPSGCGKTTLARSILGILPKNSAQITDGSIIFDHQNDIFLVRVCGRYRGRNNTRVSLKIPCL